MSSKSPCVLGASVGEGDLGGEKNGERGILYCSFHPLFPPLHRTGPDTGGF